MHPLATFSMSLFLLKKTLTVHLLKLLLVMILSFVFPCIHQCMFGQIARDWEALEPVRGPREAGECCAPGPKSLTYAAAQDTLRCAGEQDTVLVLGEPRVTECQM